MTISTIRIKFLGKTATLFRVLDAAGEVLQVCETKAQAEAFINA
jgi:hypothetical protein